MKTRNFYDHIFQISLIGQLTHQGSILEQNDLSPWKYFYNSKAVILVKKLSLFVFLVKSLNFAHIRYGRGPGQVFWARISVDFY